MPKNNITNVLNNNVKNKEDRFIIATKYKVFCKRNTYSEALEEAKIRCKLLNCKVYITKIVEEVEVDDD